MSANLDLLTMPFVWRAIVAGVTIALSAALLGVTLVLRRLSFIGDGLSHVAFGAMAVATALGLAGASMTVALPLTALAAVILLARRGRVGGDAALAMLSVGAMAAGYLLMNLFPSSANVSGDVCTTLFGAVSLLTLTTAETWLCVALAAGVILYSVLTYHRAFDIAFDEDFARASGTNVALFNFVSALVVAVVIVVSMRLVGALLVSALLVFPVISALRLARSYLAVTLTAAVFALSCAATGLVLALVLSTPVGATVVAVNALAALAAYALPRSLPALPIAALAVLAAAILRPAPHDECAPDSRSKTIVVSIAPLCDWTRNILGDATNRVNLILLERGGGDLHSFQPTAADIATIANSDLFIYAGGPSDDWVRGVLDANPNPSRAALALIDNPDCDHCHAHHEHEHEHHDEHIWLSLKNAQRLIPRIADAIKECLGTDDERLVASNAVAYSSRIAALDEDWSRTIASAPSRTLVFADRFPFSDLARDYGLDCHAAFSGCSAESEASFATVQRLAEAIDRHGVKAILILETGDERLANAVRDCTSTRDQKLLVIDSMQAGENDYLATMRANLAVIREALLR